MIRYKFVVLLVLLPLLVNSKNVKPRRRPYLEPVSSTQHPLLDQIALADNSWEVPNKILPAAYHGEPSSVHGHQDHSNLVINVVPQHKKPAEVDMVASQALANAKTAQEYVNRAIEMRNRYETTPSSSFVKYDIFENIETKLSATPASQIEVPIPKKSNVVTEVSKKSSLDYELDDFRRPDYLKQLNFNKDQEPAYSNFRESYLPEALDVYQEDKSHLFKKKVPPSIHNYPSKDEVLGTIEKSVLRYMQQLEADGRILGIANRPTAHTEIKTYYRYPTAASPTPSPSQSLQNIISTGTHSEFFKPPKGPGSKSKYSTIKPFTADTYLPDTVDLTFPSNKKRPKPIDLSALDVGQTWLHTNEPPLPPPRKPHPKPKLHFNSQSYQDINSLSYPPNKGLFDDDNVPYSSGTWSDQDPFIGASEESVKTAPGHYVPSVQILNGVAVSNPYKFHIDTLNDLFENGQGSHRSPSHDNSYGENNWSPLFDSPNAIRDSYHPVASGSAYSSPYESYSPKYNSYLDEYAWNKNHRQRGSHGHGLIDMFTSGSANRPKKVLVAPPKPGLPKRAPSKSKVKAKIRPAKRPINATTRERDADLSRELSPPPPE